MIILGLETARSVCGVALEVDGRPTASMTLLRPRSHSERLVPMVVETLARADLAPSDLDAVAVSAGPGSYTGLRIGVSTAKGLCFGIGARLVGVCTLAAYARSVISAAEARGLTPDCVAIAVGSRRGEVYFGAFDGHDLSDIMMPGILADEEAVAWLAGESSKGAVVLGGDAASRLIAGSNSLAGIKEIHHLPRAADVAALGRRALERGDEDDLDEFEPYYLKDYIARRPSGTVFDRLPF
ncbi:MAG: tRNA (adenosine(37)-N6)-threonylcarbamoyltransferase complex dimerization subunit type 1 TsaB [Rhodothermia bacterium]|nr:tRNA (adenosine(37)-N6)-threonylcarbamoyltransferase complex dimerization subunit type 1 TsaB [Rhodothermia bacterium]